MIKELNFMSDLLDKSASASADILNSLYLKSSSKIRHVVIPYPQIQRKGAARKRQQTHRV